MPEQITDHWFSGRNRHVPCTYRYPGDRRQCHAHYVRHAQTVRKDERPPAPFSWRDVACPVCGAEPGTVCIENGRRVPLVHEGRHFTEESRYR